MGYTEITVRAVPEDPNQPDQFLLDCTICGVLGVHPHDTVDSIALHHLADHGVNIGNTIEYQNGDDP